MTSGKSNKNRPVVLSIAGHDPTGGAGIQADAEAVAQAGCHTVSVISCLTVQDTQNVRKIVPVDANLLLEQAHVLLADMPIRVIKIGLLGSHDIVEAVESLLKQHADIPVVCDPVLAAGGGKSFSDQSLITDIKQRILPHTFLLTPNIPEAIQLGLLKGEHIPERLDSPLNEYTLITGTHSSTDQVIHTLFHHKKRIQQQSWQRLPHSYHGSGCTLASNISAWLARGSSIEDAIRQGQQFTWNSLKIADKQGKGQYLPNRMNSNKVH